MTCVQSAVSALGRKPKLSYSLDAAGFAVRRRRLWNRPRAASCTAAMCLCRLAVALHPPHRSAVGCTRSSGRSCLAAEPLKRFSPMSIHRVRDNLIDTDQGELSRELFDPLTSVVPEHDAFW